MCEKCVHPGTKHCWVCQKCVKGFDHHCKWLNTCVGEANYRTFFVLLWASLLFCALVAGSALYTTIEILGHYTASSEKISRYLHMSVNIPVRGDGDGACLQIPRKRRSSCCASFIFL